MLIRVAMVVGSYYPLVADVRGYFYSFLYIQSTKYMLTCRRGTYNKNDVWWEKLPEGIHPLYHATHLYRPPTTMHSTVYTDARSKAAIYFHTTLCSVHSVHSDEEKGIINHVSKHAYFNIFIWRRLPWLQDSSYVLHFRFQLKLAILSLRDIANM